jgi:predicted nucleic acid-binding Zn finger protein
MKKYLFILLFISCSKSTPRHSDELLISVTNECACSIKFYKEDILVASTIFDCNYVHILPVVLPKGKYKIVSDNSFGKTVEILFEKMYYAQSLTIRF